MVAGQPGDTVDQPGNPVDQATTPPPTTAPPPVGTTGFDSLFIGHSFFRPFASGMSAHAANVGLTDHTQEVVISGGASGSPEGLWDNPAKRAEIRRSSTAVTSSCSA